MKARRRFRVFQQRQHVDDARRLSERELGLVGTQIHETRALPIIPPSEIRQPDVRAFLRELVGRRFGKLIVMGLSTVPTADSGRSGRWVVRCDCGAYEVRRRAALMNRNALHECHDCGRERRKAAE
jgi:hypothetical protein